MSVILTSGFWKEKAELVRTEVIPYQWRALNDLIADAQPSYCMRNYKTAGALLRGEIPQSIKKEPIFQVLPNGETENTFYGFAFQDSDFSKWIEAVAYSLIQHPDSELEYTADEAIDTVCAAQREDGYLDTYFILRNPDGVFTNLRDYHELYCFGHLAEGAVAYYRATGKDKLLRCAERFAQFIARKIGPGKGQIHGYPGHEEAELGLIRLYEATGKREYLELASYFVDERGKKPYFFDTEHPESVPKKAAEVSDIDFAGDDLKCDERYQYQQAHRPVREQEDAVGHAVRGVYLYSAMADLARLNGDKSLLEACKKLWDSIVNRKMYITGSIGGTHMGEAFSHDYDLPSDTAYAETCAAIGLVFFAGRMLRLEQDSRYADVMERALYNGVLSGIALDGKSFFYVNSLECVPEDCHKDERKHHVKPIRQKWFGCACCPPNIARMLGSVGDYAVMSIGGTEYINMLLSAETASLVIESQMPDTANGSITAKRDITVALRIPDWAGEYTISADNCTVKKGYLYFAMTAGDKVNFSFDMPVRIVRANSRVRETAGQAAVMRGPLVYCIEEADNGKSLHSLILDKDSTPTLSRQTVCGQQITTVAVGGRREILDSDSLYSCKEPRFEHQALRFIPYYTWANRGENEMRVWVRIGS